MVPFENNPDQLPPHPHTAPGEAHTPFPVTIEVQPLFVLTGRQAEGPPPSLTCRLLSTEGIPVPKLQEAHAKLSEWVSGRPSHLA